MSTQLDTIMRSIKSDGRLKGGSSAYWSHVQALYGHAPTARKQLPRNIKASANIVTQQVGDPPSGFGKGIEWDRADAEILLVVFLNVADPLGITISGVQKGDTIKVVSCAGIASFSKDTGNSAASSIAGVVAAAAKAGADLLGQKEIGPVVDAAEALAKDQFKGTGAKAELRDAFGVEPGTGLKARQEGGFAIALPDAGGPFYSGDDDHKERWIAAPGDRVDGCLAAAGGSVFFPIRSRDDHNTKQLDMDGPIWITPWDWNFDDNAGYYKIFLQITRGTGTVATHPVPVRA